MDNSGSFSISNIPGQHKYHLYKYEEEEWGGGNSHAQKAAQASSTILILRSPLSIASLYIPPAAYKAPPCHCRARESEASLAQAPSSFHDVLSPSHADPSICPQKLVEYELSISKLKERISLSRREHERAVDQLSMERETLKRSVLEAQKMLAAVKKRASTGAWLLALRDAASNATSAERGSQTREEPAARALNLAANARTDDRLQNGVGDMDRLHGAVEVAPINVDEGETEGIVGTQFDGLWEECSTDDWISLMRYRGCREQGYNSRVQCCEPQFFPNYTTPLRHVRFVSSYPFQTYKLERYAGQGEEDRCKHISIATGTK